jgi:hypothetical protein
MNTLVGLASQLLDPNDREPVLGDLAEAGKTGWQALRDLLGLVLRRQAALWKNWRPWLATFGIVLPATLFLMGLSLNVALTFQLYSWILSNRHVIDPLMLHETGLELGHGIPVFLRQFFLLSAIAWTAGFLAGAISRRTVWVNALATLLPCLFCLARFRGYTVTRFSLLLFLLPAIWGAFIGVNRCSSVPNLRNSK